MKRAMHELNPKNAFCQELEVLVYASNTGQFWQPRQERHEQE